MDVVKLVAYGGASILTVENVGAGLALGPIMILGSFAGKQIVELMPEKLFVVLIEITLVVAGLGFLIYG